MAYEFILLLTHRLPSVFHLITYQFNIEGGFTMNSDSRIYVAGHTGMVGSALVRKLIKDGYHNIITKSLEELDLSRQSEVEEFFAKEKPEYVFLAAAKVGGILANNTYPADFMYSNMMIEMNVIKASFDHGVKKLLFLGSSCIYPRLAPQPMKENCLLTSELEKTNEAYALAKIAGLKFCEYLNKQYGTDYISVMPTNLYGPNDNYHPQNSHVLPAFIRRFHEAKVSGAKSVSIWGTGSALREFLFVDNLADACVYLMNHYSGNETVNIGTGKDLTIRALAELVKKIIGFEGDIEYDISKPDGTPRKLLDVSKLNSLGWKYTTELEEGIKISYEDFLSREMRVS
jgi:GDP-L-fucose synthase